MIIYLESVFIKKYNLSQLLNGVDLNCLRMIKIYYTSTIIITIYCYYLSISGISSNGIPLPKSLNETVRVSFCMSPLPLSRTGIASYLIVPHLFLSISGNDFEHATVGAIKSGIISPDVSKSYICTYYFVEKSMNDIYNVLNNFGRYNIVKNNCWHLVLRIYNT